jgi:hypothetical protein
VGGPAAVRGRGGSAAGARRAIGIGRVRIYNGGFAVFTVASILLSFHPFDGAHAAMWLIGWRLTFAVGLSAVLIAATDGLQPYGGHTMGWTSPLVITLIAGGLVLLAAFVLIENRVTAR